MHVLAELTIHWLVLAGSLAYVGYGVTRFVLPPTLKPWSPLFVPFTGYAFTVIFLRILNLYFLSGWQADVALFALATAINLAVWLWRPRTSTGTSWKESLLPLALFALVYLIAVSPLLDYGSVTVIGTNGDVEQYLAVAEYAKNSTVPNILSSPRNPLRDLADLTANDPLLGNGFSYVLFQVSTLLHWPAYKAFAPTMAFMLAGNAVAMYLFARIVLGLSPRLSGLGGLLLGMNSLILWATFFNYGRQVASLPLLPIASIAGMLAVDHPNARSIAFAGLMAAALGVTYWPVAMLYIASLAIYAVFVAWSRRRWRALLPLVAVLSLAFAAQASQLPKLLGGTVHWVSRPAASGASISSDPLPGFFLPLNHLFGLAYYVWPLPDPVERRLGVQLGQAFTLLAVVLTCGALFLAAVALSRTKGGRRHALMSWFVACALLLLVTRFGASDHYSYFKALTFSAFVATGLTVLGLNIAWHAAQALGRQAARAAATIGLALFVLAFLAVSGANTYSVVRHFLGEPQSAFVSPYVVAGEVHPLKPGESICITGAPGLQGLPMGAIASSLMANPLQPLYGEVNTAEGGFWFRLMAPGRGKYFAVSTGSAGSEPYACDYALLAADEDPVEWGYSAADLAWSNEAIKLYRRTAMVARLQFDDTSAGRIITSSEPLAVSVRSPADGYPSVEPGNSPSLVFQFGAFTDEQLTVGINGEETEVEIGPGLWLYRTRPISLPATVTVRSSGADPLFLDSLELREDADPLASKTKVDGLMLFESPPIKSEDIVAVQVRWLNTEQPPTQFGWIEARARNIADPADAAVIGRWPVDGLERRIQVSVRLPDGAIDVHPPGSAPGGPRWSPKNGDGEYLVELHVALDGAGQASAQQGALEVVKVTMRGGSVASTVQKQKPFLYHRSLSASPWTAASATFGGVIRLLGYRLGDEVVYPGGEAKLTLYWQVPKDFSQDLRVFAHLMDMKGNVRGQDDQSMLLADRYDGGSGTEVLREEHSIVVDKRAPTGRYVIETGLYIPNTMERLPVDDGGLTAIGAVVTSPLKVAGSDSSLAVGSFKPRHPAHLDLGEDVRFLGYDLGPAGPKSSASLQLTLYWQALRKMDKDYTVFVHLLDVQHAIRAQDDSQPVGALYPTSAWAEGEVVADRRTLSLDQVAPGQYSIVVGMYLDSNGQRLAVVDGEQGDNTIPLKTFYVGK